jgi:hypothetical protein
VNAPSGLGALGTSSATCHGGSSDNHLWENVTNGSILVSEISASMLSLFDITTVAVRMGMVVFMFVVMFMFVVVFMFVIVIVVMSVIMSMAS